VSSPLRTSPGWVALAALFAATSISAHGEADAVVPEGAELEAGAAGGGGLALFARKILTCEYGGRSHVDNGVLLVRDGLIEAVGRRAEVEVPEGYEQVDLGGLWLSPGHVDLHCHVAGMSLFQVNDLNDMVYLTNPGVRASASVVPNIGSLQRGVAGGVTSVLYIPGSGTNIGGQGVLLKTGFDEFEDMLIRDPGSLKLAQAGNPERFGWGIGRAFMNWNTRDTFTRGIEHAREVAAADAAGEEGPLRDPQWDVFRDLDSHEISVSTHTQIYQVVAMTLSMIRQELGLSVFLDHSTIGAWRLGGVAEELGVPAIVGPRSIDSNSRSMMSWAASTHEGIRGVAAGYQQMGNTMVGFNTDSPIVPQEELHVQATVGVRYGFDDSGMDALRGLTIVPAMAAKIDDRVGSLEVGKHADILITNGYPVDPRTSVRAVLIEGRSVYDPRSEARRW